MHDGGATRELSPTVTVGLAPCSPSHLRKNLAVIRELEDRGARIHVLCLDPLLPPRLAAQPQIAEYGLEGTVAELYGFRASESWLVEISQVRRLRRAIDAMLDRAKIDVLVLFAAGIVVPSVLSGRARKRQVPAVLIPDGVVLPFVPTFQPALAERISYVLRRAIYGWTPRGAGTVDYVLVADQSARRALASLGVPPSSIEVVGSPEYEALDQDRSSGGRDADEAALRSRLSLPADRPIIFYAHQSVYGEEVTKDVIARLAEAAHTTNGSVLVKLHPQASFPAATLREWASGRYPDIPVRVALGECTSTEAASLGAVCVTAYSTVAVEALVFGCPLVLLDYLAPRYRLDLVERYGVGISVSTADDLATETAHVVREGDAGSFAERARKALVEEFAGFDGGATARTASAILRAARLDLP